MEPLELELLELEELLEELELLELEELLEELELLELEELLEELELLELEELLEELELLELEELLDDVELLDELDEESGGVVVELPPHEASNETNRIPEYSARVWLIFKKCIESTTFVLLFWIFDNYPTEFVVKWIPIINVRIKWDQKLSKISTRSHLRRALVRET